MQITCETANCLMKPLSLLFGLVVTSMLLWKGADLKPLGMILAFMTVAIGGGTTGGSNE